MNHSDQFCETTDSLKRFNTNELFAHELAKESFTVSRFTVNNNFQTTFVCRINHMTSETWNIVYESLELFYYLCI